MNIKVINKGVPAINTDYIAEHFATWLDQYQPHMVISMMGVNDEHNENALEKIDQKNWTSRVKTLKLFQWMIQTVREKSVGMQNEQARRDALQNNMRAEKAEEVPKNAAKLFVAGMALKNAEQWEKAELIFSKLVSMNSANTSFYERSLWELGECLKRQKKYDRYTQVLSYFFDDNPYNWKATLDVVNLCKRHEGTDELIDFLQRLTNQRPEVGNFNNMLSACYAETSQQELAKKYYQIAQEIHNRSINVMTKKNYHYMVTELLKRGIQPVAVQYPTRDIEPLKTILSAYSGNVVFVDNEDVFLKAVYQDGYDEYFSDRFAVDFGHCNPKGNELLANNVAKTLLEEVFNAQ
ncbi:MAG: hypothetical protein KC713_02410 [Candidatus Omnitrophica bacterium]|nr:hypothetical protein [Candidatus Omnitrophota bacterium]